MRSILILFLLINPLFAEVITLTKDTEISAPIVLDSRDILDGQGFILTPAKDFEGKSAIVMKGENKPVHYPAFEGVGIRGFKVGVYIEDCNYGGIGEGSHIVDCQTGIVSNGAWDCTFGPRLHVLRCDTGIILKGESRPSNPLNFIDCHLESCKNHCVDIQPKVFNLHFFGCKFHANIETPPNGISIKTPENCPPITFFGGQFMFQTKGHFDKKDKPKLLLYRPQTDSVESLGRVKAVEPVLNERR